MWDACAYWLHNYISNRHKTGTDCSFVPIILVRDLRTPDERETADELAMLYLLWMYLYIPDQARNLDTQNDWTIIERAIDFYYTPEHERMTGLLHVDCMTVNIYT